MKRRSSKWVMLSAAAMSGMLVYGLYLSQLRMLESQDSVQIVAPKRFIAAGERLKEEDLHYQTIVRSAYDSDMMMDLQAAAGQEAVMPLGEGEPLRSWKIDRYRLLPAKGQSTFKLPREYVLSVSNGIRAGDLVVLYASGEGEQSARLFPQPVTVAAVKTGGNQEIDDSNNSHLRSMAEGNREQMYASRRDANGQIEDVNLNLTEEQWLRIDAMCKTGQSKLVVAYSPESLNLLPPGAREEGS